MSKIHIHKDDQVYVLNGEDRGKTGRVLSVDRKKERAIVEGINIITKSMKPNAAIRKAASLRWRLPSAFANLPSSTPRPENPHA